MKADIVKSRINALEGKLPRGVLGISGPAGVGKTQFSLTVAARLSRKYKVSLRVPRQELSNALERLKELRANLDNIVIELSEADITIIDDVYERSLERKRKDLFELLRSLKEPSLITTQIRSPSVPAIGWLRRYFIDIRLEFDGSNAYRRRMKGKALVFTYRITRRGFRIFRAYLRAPKGFFL